MACPTTNRRFFDQNLVLLAKSSNFYVGGKTKYPPRYSPLLDHILAAVCALYGRGRTGFTQFRGPSSLS
jgi:hypothetical protein